MPARPPNAAELDAFLAGVQARALRIAEIATRDRDEALDLVQDAMLKLARGYASQPASEWPPLFHRILANRILDWQRRQTLRRRLFFWRESAPENDEDADDPIEQIADPQAIGGADLLQREQAMRKLEASLRKLPARQRQAFELRIWEGLSVEETAVAMGCTGGSVKTHLSRAMQVLRSELEGVWP